MLNYRFCGLREPCSRICASMACAIYQVWDMVKLFYTAFDDYFPIYIKKNYTAQHVLVERCIMIWTMFHSVGYHPLIYCKWILISGLVDRNELSYAGALNSRAKEPSGFTTTGGDRPAFNRYSAGQASIPGLDIERRARPPGGISVQIIFPD